MKRIVTIVYFFTIPALLQAASAIPLSAPVTRPPSGSGLTVAYAITLRMKKDNGGIAELYNGGIQTFFADKHDARLRLASLMRIESAYAHYELGKLKKVTIIKESGRNKQKNTFNPDQWDRYNSKYDGSARRFTEDTAVILGHICKKVVITLKDNRLITAWYYPSTPKPSFASLLPAFSGIPGLVLKYEYTYRKKTIIYTASSISYEPINPDVFLPPAQ
ncbi:MAG: hypothetical protein JST68_11895 [Bacteroidetes bacterium]|nr:hypothetical protein [Bacteroidota bacterium]